MPYFNYDTVLERVNSDWIPFFENNKTELIKILDELNELRKTQIIYPRRSDLFRALYYHSPKDIKLTIIGQDPYINEENGTPQSMGLCFSVPRKHKKIPPSLNNIRKEIKNCYPDYIIPNHGLLKKWAKKEKILLLNASFSVCKGKSNSHAYLWKDFIDKLIEWFSINSNSAFLLMGAFANNKAIIINKSNNNKLFTTIHPSPLSAYNGFFGCNVFKRINNYFEDNNIDIINW